MPASTTGVFVGLTPVSAVVLSYVALGKPIEWVSSVGDGLCVCGDCVYYAGASSDA
jgi:drug/metabolite transporter (DMT)-like permease